MAIPTWFGTRRSQVRILPLIHNYCSLSSARSEQLAHNEKVIGSNPVGSTFTALTQLVECFSYMEEVVSSSLTSCTKRVFKILVRGIP